MNETFRMTSQKLSDEPHHPMDGAGREIMLLLAIDVLSYCRATAFYGNIAESSPNLWLQLMEDSHHMRIISSAAAHGDENLASCLGGMTSMLHESKVYD